MRENSELIVITRAKDLINYIFQISENSPKKFRYTLTAEMENTSIQILKWLIKANEVMLGESKAENERRRKYQQEVIADLKVLDAVALTARQQKCILPKQYEEISKYIYSLINLTAKWINSDKKRLSK